MSLDMYGFIDPTLESRIQGGVILKMPASGDYSGPGGTWTETSPPQTKELKMVNIVQADLKTAQFLSSLGGTATPTDLKIVHINDGTMIYPDGNGKFAHTLEFSDGQAVRTWRVRYADNRPHRNFCRAIVERYRGSN